MEFIEGDVVMILKNNNTLQRGISGETGIINEELYGNTYVVEIPSKRRIYVLSADEIYSIGSLSKSIEKFLGGL